MRPIYYFFFRIGYTTSVHKKLKKNYLVNGLHIQIKLGQTSTLRISRHEIKPPKPHAYWLAVLQFLSCWQSTCKLFH